MKSYEACPVCGSPEFVPILECVDYLVSGERFKISHCNNCSLRFTNPVPDAEEVAKYYASEAYVSHSDTREGLFFKVYQRVRQITVQKKRKLLQRYTGMKKGTVLDIGCGTGHFLFGMQEAGWGATGLEPDENARAKAISKFGLTVEPSEKLFDLSPESFDAITLWHVLEHVHELETYMKQIKVLLKPKGILMLGLPNYSCLDATHYGPYWDGYDVPRHLYHFTPNAIRILTEKTGLKLSAMKTMPYDPFYAAILSERHKRYKTGALDKTSRGNILAAAWWGITSWLNAIIDKEKSTAITYVITNR